MRKRFASLQSQKLMRIFHTQLAEKTQIEIKQI